MKQLLFTSVLLLTFWLEHSVAYGDRIGGPSLLCPNDVVMYRAEDVGAAVQSVKWTVLSGQAQLIDPNNAANTSASSVTLGAPGTVLLGVTSRTQTIVLEMRVRKILGGLFGTPKRMTIQVGIDPASTYVATAGVGYITSCNLESRRFYVENLPPHPEGGRITYTWTTSNNLVIVNGRNSSSIVVEPAGRGASGSAWVRPTLTYDDCFTTTLPARSIYIYNSAPATPTVSGPSSFVPGRGDLIFTASASGAQSYTWRLPSGWTCVTGCTSSDIRVRPNSRGGYISARANNACGSSSYRSKDVRTTSSGGCNAIMSISSSNPTSGDIAVNVVPTPCSKISLPASNQLTEEKSTKLSSPSAQDNVPNYLVEVLNSQGMRVHQGNYKSNSFKLDLSKERKGLYYVKVQHKGGTLTKRVILE